MLEQEANLNPWDKVCTAHTDPGYNLQYQSKYTSSDVGSVAHEPCELGTEHSIQKCSQRQTHTLCQAPVWESLLPLLYEKGCL